MYYGIDIGGSKIELAAYDAGLELRYSRRIATPADDYAAFLKAVASLVTVADRALGMCGHIGIGLPGLVDRRTGRQASSNLPALRGRCVQQDLANALKRPIAWGNDCQCFALSEANGGSGAGYRSVFGAIIGTGAGGGHCIDGALIGGLNGIAYEWGHFSLPARLKLKYGLPVHACGCGLEGCLERYVSGSGLSNLYRSFFGGELSAEKIITRAQTSEAMAQGAVDCYVDLLGHALANVVLGCDPEVIVLGGGMSAVGLLYERLPHAVASHLFKAIRVPAIVPPRFGGAGGTRGAALLARQQALARGDGA